MKTYTFYEVDEIFCLTKFLILIYSIKIYIMEIYNLVRASIILLVTIESSLYKVYNFPSSLTTGLNRFKDWIWGI